MLCIPHGSMYWYRLNVQKSNNLDSCNVEWTPGEYLRLHFGIISQIKPWVLFEGCWPYTITIKMGQFREFCSISKRTQGLIWLIMPKCSLGYPLNMASVQIIWTFNLYQCMLPGGVIWSIFTIIVTRTITYKFPNYTFIGLWTLKLFSKTATS